MSVRSDSRPVRPPVRGLRLLVAGPGHIGPGVAGDAAAAGYDVIGPGDDPGRWAGFDTAVLLPDERPADPSTSGPLEVLAAALAPHVRPGVLVVVAGTSRPAADGGLLSATVELLSGMRAGVDFDLGYALACRALSGPGPSGTAPTVVSGIDDRSARRTAALYRGIGRSAAPVSPVASAEFVALLQAALLTRRGPS